jgi:hypothetical protein
MAFGEMMKNITYPLQVISSIILMNFHTKIEILLELGL